MKDITWYDLCRMLSAITVLCASGDSAWLRCRGTFGEDDLLTQQLHTALKQAEAARQEILFRQTQWVKKRS